MSDSESRSLYSVFILFHLHFIIILCLFCIIKCFLVFHVFHFYLYCVVRSFSRLLCVFTLKVIFAFVLSPCVSAALSSLYIFLWVFCVCSAFSLNLCLFFFVGESRVHSFIEASVVFTSLWLFLSFCTTNNYKHNPTIKKGHKYWREEVTLQVPVFTRAFVQSSPLPTADWSLVCYCAPSIFLTFLLLWPFVSPGIFLFL